nr:rod shape-determining protein MreD [Streptococcus macacae]
MLASLLALILLLLDGQISLFFRFLFHGDFVITSHIMIIFLLYYTIFFNPYYVFFLSVSLGIIYDFYYLGIYNLAIATILFPSFIVLTIKAWKHVAPKRLQCFLIYFVSVSMLDLTSIGLAYLYRLTSYPLSDFITYNLAPSLIFNMLLFLLLQKQLKKIYL